MELRFRRPLATLFVVCSAAACGPRAEDYHALGVHARSALERARGNQRAMFAAIEGATSQPGGTCSPDMLARGRERLENYATAHRASLASAVTSRVSALASWVTTHSLYFDGHISLKSDDLARMRREVDALEQSRPYEIVMVQTAYSAPTVTAGGYTPGQYAGSLFVWDSTARRLVCSSTVNTSAPGSVTTYGRGQVGEQVASALVQSAETQAFAAAGLGERGPLPPFVANAP